MMPVLFHHLMHMSLLATVYLCLPGAAAPADDAPRQRQPSRDVDEPTQPEKLELATFGAGCFWCTEAMFERVKGVTKVVSGYAGGTTEHPTYRQVSSGQTGHAEVVQVTFDPATISYADLLEIFWKTHDPTTLNQQGPDFGTQYRSVVFYHNAQQKQVAEAYKQQLDDSRTFPSPIVTEITPLTSFYAAEDYHQDYFSLNRQQPYCRQYISPKLKKFNQLFHDKLKDQDE